MAGALDGLVVLDLTTHLSGPFCGMQLGDLGADVIKIESPQGDSMRGAPPFVEGEGAPFMLWNRNKRGIRLDLKDAADLEVFWDLVDGADVVLENFRPGVMKRLGLGWDALHARFATKRINHSVAFSDDGACTNQAESYFSRLRRAEFGQHHHISGVYLTFYAGEIAWREDMRRETNGDQYERTTGDALHHPKSRNWCGYWQRHAA